MCVCADGETGQPFREQYPVNPSYEIARGLPEYLPPKRAKDPAARDNAAAAVADNNNDNNNNMPPVRIVVHPEPIRVSYRRVRELVPTFWDMPADDGSAVGFDLALHIGMAGPRPMYQIERRGHRRGYLSKDVDGERLEDEDEGARGNDWVWHGCPDELESELDVEDVLARWEGYSPVSAPPPSPPATFFLLSISRCQWRSLVEERD